MSSSYKYDVFIAHAGGDKDIAEDLFGRLTMLGARSFVDSLSLVPGDNWDKELPAALRSSRIFAILISQSTDEAFYLKEEIAVAIELARKYPHEYRVVPVYLPGSDIESPPYGLRRTHGIYVHDVAEMQSVATRLLTALQVMVKEPTVEGSAESWYEVDLALCIDVSASLQPLITVARRSLLTVGHDVGLQMRKYGKSVDRLRLRVIQFGSDLADFKASPFVELPMGAAFLHRIADELRVSSSGFRQSRGLDALDAALRSDWTTGGQRRRHVIVIWTDRPTAATRSLETLTDKWERGMEQRSKRILLVAPDEPAWSDIGNSWENAIHFPVQEASGLVGVDYDSLVASIATSI